MASTPLESVQISYTKLKQSSADIAAVLEDSYVDVSSAFLDFGYYPARRAARLNPIDALRCE